MSTWADFKIELPHGYGIEVDTQCPECSHTRKNKRAKCLSVNTDKQTFFCHHCGYAGGLKQGVERTKVEHWQKPIYTKPTPHAERDDLDVSLVQYMAERSISAKTLRRNRISLQTVYMPQVEERVKAVCFPYFRDGEFINAKYRDREKNFRMEAGAERILYKLGDLTDTTIIVEGEIDALSVEEAGFENCVSVPDGAPAINAKSYESKFTFLDDERLSNVKTWIIAVDNDPPGTKLESELVRRFGTENCKRVMWPDGCKDANEVLTKHGAAILAGCIKQAQEFPIKGVIYARQLSKEIELLYNNERRTGVSTGWPNFDRYYTVQPGEFTVVTGVPGSGKSNWLDSLLVNLARDQDWVIPIFSPENRPLEKHLSRLMEKFVREPFRSGPTKRMSPERRDEALKWVDYYFPMIAPEDEDEWTLENIFKIAKALVRRHGIQGIVIDPWNELEHKRPPHLQETEYIGLSLRKIRQFARANNLHIWLVAHPTKIYRNKDGVYPMPTLYDVAGSANFFNKPDNGLVVHRDKSKADGLVEVHVQKVRLRDTGQLGMQEFIYNKVLADYDEKIITSIWDAPKQAYE